MASHEGQRPLNGTGADFDPLAFLMDALSDCAIFGLDGSGLISNWSGWCERLLGYKASEAIGRPLEMLFAEDDVAAGIPAQLLADSGREGLLHSDCRPLRKDGAQLDCRLAIAPLGETGFALMLRDDSARHRIERQLDASRDAVRELHRLQLTSQMIDGVAHDFSTMMAVAKDGLAQLRQPDLAKAQGDVRLKALEETIDQASALVARLMTYAHEQPPRSEEFDVIECLLGLRPLLESALGDVATLKMHLAPDMIRINADRHHFETAIFNLVINARDAIITQRHHGRITIAVNPTNCLPPIRGHPAETGSFAAISVTDTGPGITPEMRGKVFEPFFTTKGAYAAPGLGLAQVMGLARQSSGNVDLDSEVGQGAVFTLYLPRVAPRNVTALNVQTEAFAPTPMHELQGKVLLVEDNARVAETTVMMLEDIGLDALWARDAEDALAKLHQNGGGFDLVLTDVVMPRMSGIALARIIATRWPALPVVLVSGYSDELTTGHGGDLDLIQKPFTRRGLVSTLGRYLDAAPAASA